VKRGGTPGRQGGGVRRGIIAGHIRDSNSSHGFGHAFLSEQGGVVYRSREQVGGRKGEKTGITKGRRGRDKVKGSGGGKGRRGG